MFIRAFLIVAKIRNTPNVHPQENGQANYIISIQHNTIQDIRNYQHREPCGCTLHKRVHTDYSIYMKFQNR